MIKAIKEYSCCQNKTALQLLEKHPSLANHIDNDGNSLFHIAANNRLIGANFLKRLYSLAPKRMSGVNNKGDTPLHTAARQKNYSITQFILDKNPNLINTPNKNGETPLILAIKSTHRDNSGTDTIALLVHKGASTTHKDHYNKSALDYAKETGDRKIMGCLQLDTETLLDKIYDVLLQTYLTLFPIQSFDIFIKLNSGKTENFTVSDYTTVKQLKMTLLENQYHLPKQDYYYVWNSRHALLLGAQHLRDENKTLSAYGVKKESTIHDVCYGGTRS